jgi:Tol biopolymer transport system component
LPLESDGKPRSFLVTPFLEHGTTFSPDGHSVAYLSNESGRDEVYLQPFPGPGGKTLISTEGGNAPVWARSGHELFYRNGDKMMAVDITTDPELEAGNPRLLFEGRFDTFGSLANFDVTPDGRRFVMIQEGPGMRTQINVVLNWFDELKRLVPVE